jgi:hypothetical protein
MEDEAGGTCCTHGRGERCINNLVANPKIKRILTRVIRGWEEKMRISFENLGCVGTV